ncbi:hypothetical protein ES705_05786 [subsurface metagenome]
MLNDTFIVLKDLSGIASLTAILIFWFYTFGKYSSKLDMVYEIIIKSAVIDLAKHTNPSSQKFFSSLPLKKQKYIEKISAKEKPLEWKVSTIVGAIRLNKMKEWSGQTESLTILRCLLVIINKHSPSPPNPSKNHSNNSNKGGFS